MPSVTKRVRIVRTAHQAVEVDVEVDLPEGITSEAALTEEQAMALDLSVLEKSDALAGDIDFTGNTVNTEYEMEVLS